MSDQRTVIGGLLSVKDAITKRARSSSNASSGGSSAHSNSGSASKERPNKVFHFSVSNDGDVYAACQPPPRSDKDIRQLKSAVESGIVGKRKFMRTTDAISNLGYEVSVHKTAKQAAEAATLRGAGPWSLEYEASDVTKRLFNPTQIEFFNTAQADPMQASSRSNIKVVPDETITSPEMKAWSVESDDWQGIQEGGTREVVGASAPEEQLAWSVVAKDQEQSSQQGTLGGEEDFVPTDDSPWGSDSVERDTPPSPAKRIVYSLPAASESKQSAFGNPWG